MNSIQKIPSLHEGIEDEKESNRRVLIFALIYFTFFLDNVLLTVLVPIIPDWVRGESLVLWAHASPAVSLAGLLNHTHHRFLNVTDTKEILMSSISSAEEQIIVGVVLGVKALTQLVMAPVASGCVARFGPCVVLRLSTVTLTVAAMMFGVSACWSGHGSVWCAGLGRAAHGAGSALAGVSGLALAAAALPPSQRDRALGALLGAVALGVLVGYPFGGAAYAIWNRSAPFLLVAVALLTNLGFQIFFLDNEEFEHTLLSRNDPVDWMGTISSVFDAGRGVAGACAGAVLLTTSVMASLEPCLPLWLMERFHPQKWQLGAVFIPDSAGYLIAASLLGGWSKKLGAERVALAGVLAVGFAALIVPLARSVSALAWPHAILGVGLGGTDAALVPALLARAPSKVHHLAALLQAASSAAYAIGPVCGGLVSAWLGFPTTMRILGVANILYAAALYRILCDNPLSEQWGAKTNEDNSTSSSESTPFQPKQYRALRNTVTD